MSEFDGILIGGFLLTVVVYFLGEKPKKLAVIVFLLAALFAIFLAYHFNWESSILRISAPPTNSSSNNNVSTDTSHLDTTQHISPSSTAPSFETDTFLGEAYESHTPNDGITASVEFRKWDSSTDKDLRNNTYTNETGICLYSFFSNMFNAIGGGGSERDRIVSEIHIPISTSPDIDYTELYLVGSIVAEQSTQSSGAYADVAILIDGIEKWRNEDHITSNTVQPVDFAVNLANVKSEIIILTSCIPLNSGLALGYVDIDISYNSDTSVQQPPIQEVSSDDEILFVRAFETHSPNNNGVDFVEFRKWDSFSDADLRTEQYINKDGLFVKYSNTFSMLGSSVENQIESEIHLVINPQKELAGGIWTGTIVAEQSTQGSSAYADVAIFVDGIEKWRTSEPITGNTVAPIEFSIDLSDALYEVIIKVYCTPNDSGLALGFVNMDFNYS